VAADPDQRIQAQQAVAFDRLVAAILLGAVGHRVGERIAAGGGAEYRAAEPQNVVGVGPQPKLFGLQRPRQKTVRAAVNADHDVAVAFDRAMHDSADRRVQARAVATAGEHPDSLGHPLSTLLRSFALSAIRRWCYHSCDARIKSSDPWKTRKRCAGNLLSCRASTAIWTTSSPG